MSALAMLRDLAGCRAVLYDARLEADALYHEVAARNDADTMIAFQRAARRVADVERVVAEAEAALWDGGEAERVDCWVFRRRPPQRPDLSLEAYVEHFVDDYEGANASDWADERRLEYRDRVRAYLATDWPAWDDRSARTRGRAWARRTGVFPPFVELLRERYPEAEPPWRTGGGGPPIGSDAMREQLAEAVAAIDAVGSEPDVVYLNHETYTQLQAQQRTELIAGHRRVATRVGRRAGASTAARASALARVYGTGAFEVPPHAFDSPIARRSDAADALAYAWGHMSDRAATGPQRTGYRPRWAPVLAATLSEILFKPLVPAEPAPRSDDGIEVRARAWANLITDGPASGVPGMGDP